MDAGEPGISIVLPALNEAGNIEPLVEEIRGYFADKDLPYEIIIVNDGSSDATGTVADALASRSANVSVIHHARNQGYGKSLRDGFRAGRYEYVFFTDADRQFRMTSLDEFLPWLRNGRAEMIIGYRINRQDTRLRKLLSWSFNRVMAMIFPLGYRDIDCAFKLMKKAVVERLDLQADDFLFNAELLAKARIERIKVVQLGVMHFPRLEGRSTVSCKHMLLTLKRLVRLRRVITDFKRRKERRSR